MQYFIHSSPNIVMSYEIIEKQKYRFTSNGRAIIAPKFPNKVSTFITASTFLQADTSRE